MGTMNMPRFTAEASLFRMPRVYRITAGSGQNPNSVQAAYEITDATPSCRTCATTTIGGYSVCCGPTRFRSTSAEEDQKLAACDAVYNFAYNSCLAVYPTSIAYCSQQGACARSGCYSRVLEPNDPGKLWRCTGIV